jgi:molecular chaperone GrpE
MTSNTPTDDATPAPESQAETAAPDPVATLAAENEGLRDQVLRTLAEMENLRRRTEREVQDAGRYAIAAFARDVLSVGDNLRRALEAVPAEARASAEPATAGLVDGVEMTERELLKVLEKHGVKRIDPVGQRFDPNVHQAMFEVPNPEIVSGTVVQVLQAGYVIGERVLRPALVGVAKGGPREAPRPAPAADTGSEQAGAA